MLRTEFWRHYALEELNKAEWEALCDGCALCCLHKLEDEDTGRIAQTDVRCRYLDINNCQCTDYNHRHINVPDCVPFDADKAKRYHWLPETCAYRRMAEGRALPYWHYLETGDKTLVHALGVSAQNQSVSEVEFEHEDEWQDRVVRWLD